MLVVYKNGGAAVLFAIKVIYVKTGRVLLETESDSIIRN